MRRHYPTARRARSRSTVPRYAVTFLAIYLCILSVADTASATDSYFVRVWQPENGLPSGIIRSLAQAADGWLWVGTAEGVVRFDGFDFSGFDGDSGAELAHRPAQAIFPLPGGDVWVATSRGGLMRWNGQRLTVVWNETAAGATAPPVILVSEAEPGRAYIKRGDALWVTKGDAEPVPIAQTDHPNMYQSLVTSKRSGLGQPLSSGEAADFQDSIGRRWSVSAAKGISVYEPDVGWQTIAIPNAGAGFRATVWLEDTEHNLWLGTPESGLIQISKRRVAISTPADGLSDRTVLAVLEDRDGALWVATKAGGLDRLSGGRATHFAVGQFSRPVSSLCEDLEGTLWVADRSGNVYRMSGDSFQPAFQDTAGKMGPMAVDRAGHVWLGSERGVIESWQGTVRERNWPAGVGKGEVSAIAVDAANHVWVGTKGGSLLCEFDGQFATETSPDALGIRPITALVPEADGALWVATLDAGLFRWKDGALLHWGEAEGLPDPRLTCVVPDKEGGLWLGSLGGIFRVPKADLLDIPKSRSGLARWLQLGRSDGMLSRECTGLCQPAGIRSVNGEILIPTMDGLVSVNPSHFAADSPPAPVTIMEAKANNRSLALAGPLRIGPGKSQLEIRYTACAFAAPEKLRFRIQLKGWDSHWRFVGAQRTVAFEALPPGNYQFAVQAKNGDGIWNEAATKLAIIVLPHWSETLWFRWTLAVACALAAAAAGWAVARVRARLQLAKVEQQRAREMERTRIAQDLHDDLGASLTEISLLARLACHDAPGLSTNTEALPEIADKARALVGVLDEIVWAVNPKHDTLASLAEYLIAFSSRFLDAACIAFRIDVPPRLPEIPLDAERRHNIYLAVRETLNNAAKHSGATEVALTIRIGARSVEITVADNGRGFDPSHPSDRSGTHNIVTRLERVGGSCEFDSVPGAGTSVRLEIPLVAPGESLETAQ